MINVTVIGFGNVGASLSLLLLNNRHKICLNVMEPDPQREGAFLDLAHGMQLYPHKELHINNEDLLLNSDFIFYTAGTPNIHGGSRLSTAKQNIQLTKEIFEPRTFKETAFIIVITNPVDIVTHSVYQYSGLPASQVVGTGTFLDSVRLDYYLSELTNFEAEDFNAVVLGEHGESQFPVYSITQLKGKPINEYTEFTPEILEKAKQLTKSAAYQIRETQKGTTYGVSKCAEVLLDYLLENEERQLTLTMLTNQHYKDLLELDHDICISMPVLISNGIIQPNNSVQFSEDELADYKKSADILANIIE